MKQIIFITIHFAFTSLLYSQIEQNDTIICKGETISLTVLSPFNSLPITTCDDNIFNPYLGYETATDIDGNEYLTIQIGTQKWMAENLRTSKYNNGDPIPNVINDNQWLNLTSGAWSFYTHNNQYNCPYGKLYNGHAIADPRGICPMGWRVPTNTDWELLRDFLDPNANANNNIAGGQMKSIGTQYWWPPNFGATNESGFSALPGGKRDDTGSYDGITLDGYWWSATEFNTLVAYYFSLNRINERLIKLTETKETGYSCRCIKN